MQKQLLSFLRYSSIIIAIELAIATTLSFIAGYYLGVHFMHFSQPLIDGMWTGISAILVVQATHQKALAAGWFRIIGSFIGALMSAIIVSLLGYTILAFIISLLLTVIICSLVRLESTFRLACITILVIMITGKLAHIHPWLNAIIRFAESATGVIVAIIIVFIFNPLQKLIVEKT